MRIAVAAALIAAGVAAAEPRLAPHYAIELRLDPNAHALSANVELQLPPRESNRPDAFLLGATYAVSDASAEPGATVSVQPPAGLGAPQTILVVRDGKHQGRPISVRLRYAGRLQETGGINAIAADRIELSADALWYPLSTNFNSRITFDARISGMPQDFVVASPDILSSEGDVRRIRRERPSQDIAFYASAPLQRLDLGRLQLYARAPDKPQVQNYRSHAPRALAFLESMLGPCPRQQLVVAVADRKSGVGYSRPGYVVVANAEGVDPKNPWAAGGYIAHELSHAWWSNADFTGDDYWLVESTAEYSALRFVEEVWGRAERDRLLEAKRDRSARGGPILGHGRPSDDAVYARGPLLLFELEERIGRSALAGILRELAQKEHVATADFIKLLGERAGAEMAANFQAQLQAP